MREIFIEGKAVVAIMEPGSGYVPSEGVFMVESDDETIELGYLYINGKFSRYLPDPVRFTKIEFRRLLKPFEAAVYRLLQAAPRVTMQELQLAFNPATPPSQAMELQVRIAVEDAIQQFDLLPEFIELNHPDTEQFLGIMALAGMFGADAQTRIPHILSGRDPV